MVERGEAVVVELVRVVPAQMVRVLTLLLLLMVVLLLLVVQDEQAAARLDLRHGENQVGRGIHL